MALQVTIDRVGDILKGLKTLEDQRVLVGIPANETERRPGPDGTTQPINNAALGYIHEHGSPEANIPARPHLMPAVASLKDYVTEQYAAAAKDAMEGKHERVSKRLNAMGLKAQAAVRQYIVDGEFEPLAEATLAGRARRKVTRTKPLIDTGQMRNAYTYVIRKRGR